MGLLFSGAATSPRAHPKPTHGAGGAAGLHGDPPRKCGAALASINAGFHRPQNAQYGGCEGRFSVLLPPRSRVELQPFHLAYPPSAWPSSFVRELSVKENRSARGMNCHEAKDSGDRGHGEPDVGTLLRLCFRNHDVPLASALSICFCRIHDSTLGFPLQTPAQTGSCHRSVTRQAQDPGSLESMLHFPDWYVRTTRDPGPTRLPTEMEMQWSEWWESSDTRPPAWPRQKVSAYSVHTQTNPSQFRN